MLADEISISYMALHCIARLYASVHIANKIPQLKTPRYRRYITYHLSFELAGLVTAGYRIIYQAGVVNNKNAAQ